MIGFCCSHAFPCTSRQQPPTGRTPRLGSSLSFPTHPIPASHVDLSTRQFTTWLSGSKELLGGSCRNSVSGTPGPVSACPPLAYVLPLPQHEFYTLSELFFPSSQPPSLLWLLGLCSCYVLYLDSTSRSSTPQIQITAILQKPTQI